MKLHHVALRHYKHWKEVIEVGAAFSAVGGAALYLLGVFHVPVGSPAQATLYPVAPQPYSFEVPCQYVDDTSQDELANILLRNKFTVVARYRDIDNPGQCAISAFPPGGASSVKG